MKALGFNKMRVLFAKLKQLWGLSFFSLQMDLLTSSHQHAAYGAVTCSIFDEYYDLHNLLLHISPFPEARHTGKNIAAWLRGALEHYGLTAASGAGDTTTLHSLLPAPAFEGRVSGTVLSPCKAC